MERKLLIIFSKFKYIDIIKEGISKADLEKTVGKPVETVPQIFVDSAHIGGFTEFEAYAKENLGLYRHMDTGEVKAFSDEEFKAMEASDEGTNFIELREDVHTGTGASLTFTEEADP